MHRLGREVEGEQYLPADADFFRQIVGGVIKSQLDIDPTIDKALTSDWPVGRIDATLRAMATQRPRTLDELGTINGVGVSKLERYGERMLQVLREAA